MLSYSILETLPSAEYALLDSGDGEKLERWGQYVVSRPDPQALWKKNLSNKEWSSSDAFFSRDNENSAWSKRRDLPDKWQVKFQDLKFWIKLSAFKHTGLFPEQAGNWSWIIDKIKSAKRQTNILNLFGYTGGASLAAASAGAEVCHLDGSKGTVAWAKDNAELSGLAKKPIRWIVDDARAFVGREIRRGRKYDGVIMDPPAFGHGPKGELWKIENDFLPLLDLCKKVLSDEPIFFLINGYAAGYSAISYKNNLDSLLKDYKGGVEIGELTIREIKTDRLLPCGIFARWSSD